MKRQSKSNQYYTLFEFYPKFFWQKCDLCGIEFKKEYGWKIRFQNYISRIICNNCAETREEAESLALTWGKSGCDRPNLRILLEHRKKHSL